MSSEPVKDGEGSNGPGKVWILVGLLAAAAGIAIMVTAGSGSGVSETATQQEDSIPYVETAAVESAGDSYQVTAPGRLQARETLQLVGEVSGKVTGINPDLELGGRVTRGETLVQIDDGDIRDDIAQAKAQLSTAEARLEQALAERDRQQRLAEIGAAPEKAAEQAVAAFEDAQASVDQAEAQLAVARRRLEKASITAPFDAIVTDENVSLGTFVSPGQSLATLISAGAGEIRASLPAEDVNAVRTALRAAGDERLAVRAIPNSSSLSSKPLEGYLAEFSPVIDQQSRTATIIAVFPDAFTPENEGDVFTDDFMDLVIQGVSEAPIWRIPAGAIRQDSFVWVVDESEETRRVEVEPIDRTHNAVLVHAPDLSGGERVMTTVLAEEIDGMRVHLAETAS
ncbi:MAG: efflux RND transporter periplasmic adaptor subunit [Henriciella sp.]|uniref:efflux RND transporter periplasmic adaptor subunit n=1 Tax=Henriciella sp. TaxID=1968823 RepID=UPI0032EBC633